MKLVLVLAATLVTLALVAPTVAAQPGGPCICDPQPCGNPPSVVADPSAYGSWLVCRVFGGSPW